MNVFIQGHSGARALLLLLGFVIFTTGQDFGEKCFAQFHKRKDDFVLDVDASVKDGATFLSSPKLDQRRDCLVACCKQQGCNVAFMERGDEEDKIKSCFLFDCFYRQKYVCHFIKKKGFMTEITDSIYQHYSTDTKSSGPDNPPVADAGPDRVVRPKESLTLDGIQSTDDHEVATYSWEIIGDHPYIVIEKSSHFPDQITVSNLTSGSYKFQLTVTDNSGQSDSSMINVLVLTEEQSEHHCMVPVKPGPCRGAYPRWHHNAASGECETFSFGGCKPNLNNYLTEEECKTACVEESGGSRRLPAPNTEKCDVECTKEQFTCDNGCCLDPALECDDFEQCSDGSDEKKCADYTAKFRILLTISVDEKKARCTETPDPGSCRDSVSKWYYYPYTQKCRLFSYGGCGGNNNKFDDEETCKRVCHNITEADVFLRKEEFEKQQGNHMDILPVVVTLVAVALILFALLVYFYMKKKKSNKHQSRAVNNTAIADRERLVYNSTTKPI